MNKKILIVDDEIKIRILMKDFLRRNGFDTIDCKNGLEAIDLFLNDKSIDLIILDVMMPELNGWETCKKIREFSDTIPIIILTAKTENEDVIKSFKTGADDYIAKPFHLPILLERVKALLKRTKTLEEIQLGSLYINLTSRTIKVDNNLIDLSTKEYELLLFLLQNKNVVLSRDEILKKVWNYDYLGDGRTIDTHIKTLRNKLGGYGESIKTVWGIGYKLEIKEED